VTPRTDVVLLGAGHTHLHVLDRAAQLRAEGIHVTVVAPSRFDYSGVATAIATGALPPDAGRVDVARLASLRGAAHRCQLAARVDTDRRRVSLEDGSEVAYDLLSVNVGSVTSLPGIEVADEVLRVKPLGRLHELGTRIAGADVARPVRVSIVGSGPTGLELAGSLALTYGERVQITVFERAEVPGPDLPRGGRRRVLRELRRRGVELRAGVSVRALTADHVEDEEDATVPHDVAVVATGLRAAPAVERFGLGDARGIPVRATLQHREHDEVYAVGDCAWFTPRPLAKLGVYGVRQGPVLVASLLAAHRGRPLPTYDPQRRSLRIIDIGGGVALATRGRWWWYGRSSLALKRAIDGRWLARYR
jgi:NADH dehydrogenase FAD-containing subunit